MKNILFINYEYPPLGGGAGRAMSEIALRLAIKGHHVTVITSQFGDLPKREQSGNLSIIRIPTQRKYLERCSVWEMIVFILSSIICAPYILKDKKVDCVVAFFTIPSGISAWLMSKIKKCRLIISLRGGDVPGFMSKQLGIYHKITKPLIRFLWLQSDCVVANSLGLKNLALKTCSNQKIEVIPNGIDLNRWLVPKISPWDSNGEFVILTVGRLTAQKSVHTLIQACFELKQKISENNLSTSITLWIIGDGPERRNLENLAIKLGLEHQTKFFGWMDQINIKQHYLKAQVFVLTSLNEGMPNVVLEAMACGLPVVASSVEGINELVDEGENGFIVPLNSPSDVANQLNTLFKNPELRNQMAQKSLQKVAAFDWDRVAQTYEELCIRES